MTKMKHHQLVARRKISKNNSITVLYLEGGIQSWTENNFPLIEGS